MGMAQVQSNAGRAAVLTPAQSHLQSSRYTVTSLIYNQSTIPALKDLNTLQLLYMYSPIATR